MAAAAAAAAFKAASPADDDGWSLMAFWKEILLALTRLQLPSSPELFPLFWWPPFLLLWLLLTEEVVCFIPPPPEELELLPLRYEGVAAAVGDVVVVAVNVVALVDLTPRNGLVDLKKHKYSSVKSVYLYRST